MSLLDQPQISGEYFFPRRDPIDSPFIVSVDGAELHCYRHHVDDAQPTILHFHGNGETVGDYIRHGSGASFANLGVNVVFAEYRGYGGSTGAPQLVAQLGDCEAILSAIDVDERLVVAFGRSIGSLYAIELCARRPHLGGLIIESGIADPAERFLNYADLSALGVEPREVVAESHRYFDHEKKLRGYSNPLLVLHCEDDQLINLSHARRILQWSGASEEQKRLKIFPRGGHNAIMAMNQVEYFAEVQSLLDVVSKGR